MPSTRIDASSDQNDDEPTSVLIVEDEVDLANLYSAWLQDSYRVQTANSGEEALAKLDDSIDIVLLDRRMPDLSGGEVLAEIRTEGLDCRAVIISAVNPDFDVIGMGFDEYLTKPVSRDDITEGIERMKVRASYDEQLQELYQLISTRATLEAEKSSGELDANAEYEDLLRRISALKAEIESQIDEFETEDFKAAFRDLERN